MSLATYRKRVIAAQSAIDNYLGKQGTEQDLLNMINGLRSDVGQSALDDLSFSTLEAIGPKYALVGDILELNDRTDHAVGVLIDHRSAIAFTNGRFGRVTSKIATKAYRLGGDD